MNLLSKNLVENLEMDLSKIEINEADLNAIDYVFLNKFNNDVLSDLQYFNNVKECLLVGFDNITNEDIQIINSIKSIKKIRFSNCKFYRNDVNLNCPNVENVIFELTNLETLKNCVFENVMVLKIIDNNDFNIEDIEMFSKIENVCIYNSNIINSQEILKLTNLKVLDLQGAILDKNDLLSEIRKDIKVINKSKYIKIM